MRNEGISTLFESRRDAYRAIVCFSCIALSQADAAHLIFVSIS